MNQLRPEIYPHSNLMLNYLDTYVPRSHDARTAWLECDDVDWIDWLIGKADGQFGFPTSKQIAPLLAPIYAKWRAKRDAIDAEWLAKLSPIDAEYEAVIKLLIVFVDETPEQIVRL